MSFQFVGAPDSSKSVYNRYLIVQSFYRDLNIKGHSRADDVRKMKEALHLLATHQSGSRTQFDCGEAGTVLRFLTLRASRLEGDFYFNGSKRLLERPQEELFKLLRQLGSYVELKDDVLHINSAGWKPMGDQIYIDCSQSSQFASALILSAWNLPVEIFFRLSPQKVSYSYFKLTLDLVRSLGMRIVEAGPDEYHIPPSQKLDAPETIQVEPDMSSAFSLVACAMAGGDLRLSPWPKYSFQPDFEFLKIIDRMHASYELLPGVLVVRTSPSLIALEADLTNTPDLFPCLSALCALAEGTSQLSGLSHLRFKESDRLENMISILNRIGVYTHWSGETLEIRGNLRSSIALNKNVEVDPDKDHRIAMAAMVLKTAGYPIKILNSEVVSKSFPQFFQIVGDPK